MNTNKVLKEGLLILLTIIPLGLLFFVWGDLPAEVPIHWNIKGEVDGWGDKSSLLLIALFISIPIYLLMLFLPKIAARKDNIEAMGGKYFMMRFSLQLLMSSLLVSIISASAGLTDIGIEYMISICFIVFMILFGNYMTSIRPNYFMGIRTPWTLDNEEVWKKTHTLGGRLWVISGLVGLIVLFTAPTSAAFAVIIMLMLLPMIVALIYSFVLFKKLQKED